MAICALPLVALEMSVAQFSNLGPGKYWIVCPLFRGVGFGMVMVTTVVSVYYNVIIGWALYYFGVSFSSTLPWSTCGHEWNTHHCFVRGDNKTLFGFDAEHINGTSAFNPKPNDTYSVSPSLINFENISKRTPTEEFWEFHVLQRSGGIDELGTLRWQLLLCLLAAWVAAFLCFIKGIKTSGKVMYVAATLPYVILAVLLIRGLFLPGSTNGLKFYLIPKWEKLLEPSVWSEAAVQVFFSAGIGFGTLTTLSSYNKFSNNCLRDGMIIPMLDGLTSWFAGMVIFVTLGYMAHQSDLDVSDVVAEGPGIAFMVYPEALAQLPLPQLWCVCFFLLLFTVGLDSQIVHMQTITTAIFDNFPRLSHRVVLVNALTSLPLFLLGIFCVTQGGAYILTLLDWYCASIAVMPLVICETLALTYIYGVDRLYEDIEWMTGSTPRFGWKVMWKVVAPLCTLALWISSLQGLSEVKYSGLSYPTWAVVAGWFIAIIPLVPVPIGMVMALRKTRGTWKQRLRRSLRPLPEWGPADKEIKEIYFKKHQDSFWRDDINGTTMKPMI